MEKLTELDAAPKLLSEKAAMHYVGLGQTYFRRWAKEIGARRKFGKRVLYDRATIDAAIDEQAEK